MVATPRDGVLLRSGLQGDFRRRISVGFSGEKPTNFEQKRGLAPLLFGNLSAKALYPNRPSHNQVMSMLAQNDLSKARIRSIFLTLLMVLSTTAALATTASASVARSYTTNRDPTDLAIGDFDCDGHNDLAVATDGTHSMTILYNDGNGNFNERQDIWVAGNQSRNADWDEFANVEQVEVGEFTGDSAIDIVIYQRTTRSRPTTKALQLVSRSVSIIENDGCGNRDWTIGQRYTHFWVWDMKVGDADQDGNDDIFVLELEEDLSRQNIVTYRSPITSTTQGSPTFWAPQLSTSTRPLKSVIMAKRKPWALAVHAPTMIFSCSAALVLITPAAKLPIPETSTT